jgi:hypothetical protein
VGLCKRLCKDAFAAAYIRKGSFPTTFVPNDCITSQVYCLNENQARVKQHFEERNPEMIVRCPLKNYCEAYYRPESFFN